MPLHGPAAGDRREYADRASFDAVTFTIAAWVKLNTVSAFLRMVNRNALGTGTNGAWTLATSSGTKFAFAGHSGGSLSSAASSVTPVAGRWYHLIGIWTDGVGAATYIDNVADGTAANATSLAALATPIRFFEDSGGAGHGDVVLAYVGHWNIALSADDRAALWAGAHPLTVRPDALILADECEVDSIDMIGMEAPTNSGQLRSVPGGMLFPELLKPPPWSGRLPEDEEEDENYQFSLAFQRRASQARLIARR